MSEHEKVNILLVDDQPSKLLSYEVILHDLSRAGRRLSIYSSRRSPSSWSMCACPTSMAFSLRP
jgi:hypothetical protein